MKKKPTKKNIETVLSGIIEDLMNLKRAIYGIDVAMTEYVRYKNDENGFVKHMKKKTQEQVESEGNK